MVGGKVRALGSGRGMGGFGESPSIVGASQRFFSPGIRYWTAIRAASNVN
jgi:hypothetical protein